MTLKLSNDEAKLLLRALEYYERHIMSVATDANWTDEANANLLATQKALPALVSRVQDAVPLELMR